MQVTISTPKGRLTVFCTYTYAYLHPYIYMQVTISTPKGKLAVFWFHTAFIRSGVLQLSKHELDKACKDKKGHLHPEFGVVVHFASPSSPGEEESSRCMLEERSSRAPDSELTPELQAGEGRGGEASMDEEEEEEEDDDDDERAG